MNTTPVATYKLRRHRTTTAYGTAVTMWRAEVFSGTRRVHCTREHTSRAFAINDALKYIKASFSPGIPVVQA